MPLTRSLSQNGANDATRRTIVQDAAVSRLLQLVIFYSTVIG